jgi:hypothetical protein
MRTVITLLFFIIVVSFLIFLKITSENSLISPKYIGSGECKGCHSVKSRGDQYNIWRESKHSRTAQVLTEDRAIRYAKQNNIKNPTENADCLRCHTTAFGEKQDLFERSFNSKDGIQCEECHNAGSEYSKYDIMVSSKKFLSKGGEHGNKLHCLKCHSPNLKNKNFNRCPFQNQNFKIETSLEKIKHNIPNK